MIALMAVVFMTSLLGSVHCAGMCGPFALLATGSTGRPPLARLTAYHFGRLTTYLTAGVAAGTVGAALDQGGQLLGWQSVAARIAGAAMILIGLAQLSGRAKYARGSLGTRVGGALARLRKPLARVSPTWRALLTGAITTLLPCGWLYLFVIAAAGTGSPLSAAAVMVLFWAGTLPILSALVLGAGRLAAPVRRWLPAAASLALVVVGTVTLVRRAEAELGMLNSFGPAAAGQPTTVEHVQQIADQPLPCCQAEVAR